MSYKHIIAGFILSSLISGLVHFMNFPPLAWAALLLGLPWNIPGIGYFFWDITQHGYDGPRSIHGYIALLMLFIGLYINCCFIMKYAFSRTTVGLILFIGGVCVLMLGSSIPNYGKITAVVSIVLGIVALFTKININFDSLMGGHTGGIMRDDDD